MWAASAREIFDRMEEEDARRHEGAHWAVLPSSPTMAPTGLYPAQVVYPGNANYNPGWVANGPTSAWICRSAFSSFQGGYPYGFFRTVDLTGYDASTAYIAGYWGFDDSGSVKINNNVVFTSGYTVNPLKLVASSMGQYFTSGINTISIWLTSGDQTVDGVRVDAALYAVPLPTATNLHPTSQIVTSISTGLDSNNKLITQGGQSDAHYLVMSSPQVVVSSSLPTRSPTTRVTSTLALNAVNGPIILSTGLSISDTVLTQNGALDSHWKVSSIDGRFSIQAQVVTPVSPNWYSKWVANNGKSAWICRNASSAYESAAYLSFYTSFDLTGFDLKRVALQTNSALRLQGIVFLNSIQVCDLTKAQGCYINAGSRDSKNFKQGINALSIRFSKSDEYGNGVRFEGSVYEVKTRSNVGAIVGGVVGSVLGCCCLGCIGFCVWSVISKGGNLSPISGGGGGVSQVHPTNGEGGYPAAAAAAATGVCLRACVSM